MTSPLFYHQLTTSVVRSIVCQHGSPVHVRFQFSSNITLFFNLFSCSWYERIRIWFHGSSNKVNLIASLYSYSTPRSYWQLRSYLDELRKLLDLLEMLLEHISPGSRKKTRLSSKRICLPLYLRWKAWHSPLAEYCYKISMTNKNEKKCNTIDRPHFHVLIFTVITSQSAIWFRGLIAMPSTRASRTLN